MREKILRFMSLVMVSFDDNIKRHLDTFAADIKSAMGEVPPDMTEALALVGTTMRARHSLLEDRAVEIYSKNFTEADVDALLAFYESDAYKKLSEVSPAIMTEVSDAESLWIKETMQSIETDLQRILGAVAPAPAAEAPPAAAPVETPPDAPPAA